MISDNKYLEYDSNADQRSFVICKFTDVNLNIFGFISLHLDACSVKVQTFSIKIESAYKIDFKKILLFTITLFPWESVCIESECVHNNASKFLTTVSS